MDSHGSTSTRPAGRAASKSVVRLIQFVLVVGLVVVLPGIEIESADAKPYPWNYDVSQTLLSLPTNHSPAPFVADWNDDGLDDLIVGFRSTGQFGGVAVYPRQLDGTLGEPFSAFASGDASSVIAFTLYVRPVLVDWDGDGNQDLIFGQHYGNKGVVFCPNEGANDEPIFNGANCNQMQTNDDELVGGTTGSTVAYVSPEVVDWDNDGDLDLIVGTGSNTAPLVEKGVRLYENIGTSTDPILDAPEFIVSKGDTSGLAFENYYEPAIVDINDDGKKDLMIGGSRNGSTGQEFVLRECLNTGTDDSPIFDRCGFHILPGLVNNVIDFHDWDGDGYLDLMRGFHSGFVNNPVTYFHGESPDTDGDGVSDSLDNCPDEPNPADMRLDRVNAVQMDTDGDGAGDACDEDIDGDDVPNIDDNCVFTPNRDRSDVDSDGRGDVCDPKDDRPGQPGVGSYEWEQANKTEWGRKPVIMLRADAMSRGYRQEIAEALTMEALNRDLPFSLAVIPWNEDFFSPTQSAEFLSEVAGDPNFEMVQHGTYHTCMYLPNAGMTEEFDCGMDLSRSFNLMRVGKDSMENSVIVEPEQPLAGFIPPADAFNDASVEAMQALGYNYISSAWYRENTDSPFVDENGMVHLPWSQIACGNGAASWTNCATTEIEAHSGVDCADQALCEPQREPSPKDYSDWEQFAENSLKERCRHDLTEESGVCNVLLELTSYDKDFALGALDEVAFEIYKQMLDDLEDLAEEEGAVFMTLGQFAATQLIEDTVDPEISVNAPVEGDYERYEMVTIDFEVTDDLSGVYATEATLDGEPVEDGDTIDMLSLQRGEHTLVITAEDTAGNTSEANITFNVISTLDSLQGTIERFAESGDISNQGIATSLLQKLEAAEAAVERGNLNAARNNLNALIRELEAQHGKQIRESAADLLLDDARHVRDNL